VGTIFGEGHGDDEVPSDGLDSIIYLNSCIGKHQKW